MTRITDLATRVRTWFTKTAGAALLSYTLNVAPVPASRPRVTRWGVYYGKHYAAWLKAAEEQLVSEEREALTGPVACLVEIVAEKAKTSKREYPRGDNDNFAKGPLDAMTKSEKFWRDDDDVVLLVVTKRFAEPGESPRTNVSYFPVKED